MSISSNVPSVSKSLLIVMGTLLKTRPCPPPPEPFARDHVAGGPATPSAHAAGVPAEAPGDFLRDQRRRCCAGPPLAWGEGGLLRSDLLPRRRKHILPLHCPHCGG